MADAGLARSRRPTVKLIDKETRYVNRSALVVRPKEPSLRSLAEAEPESSEGLDEAVRAAATVYLVPAIEMEVTREVVLQKYWREVLEQELSGWYRDVDI